MLGIGPIDIGGRAAGKVDRWMKGSYDIGKKQSRRNNIKEQLDSLTTSQSPRVLAEGFVEYQHTPWHSTIGVATGQLMQKPFRSVQSNAQQTCDPFDGKHHKSLIIHTIVFALGALV